MSRAPALFDLSFMHCARVGGRSAVSLAQQLTPRPLGDLAPGRIRYALALDEAARQPPGKRRPHGGW